MLRNIIAKRIFEASIEDAGGDAVNAIQNSLIDLIGVTAAAFDEPSAKSALNVGRYIGNTPEVAVIGMNCELPVAAAAFVNAANAHCFDYDDSHLPSLAHLTVGVAPVVLALAQQLNLDGRTLLTAHLVGIEVGGRIGRCVSSPEWGGTALRLQGFFPTSVLSTIGSAAAAAKAMTFDESQIANTLSLAANMASGLAGISKGDSWGKRSQAGWAAHAGMMSALMVKEGLSGPQLAFEGPQGFFHAFSGDQFDEALLTEPWKDLWECQRISYKNSPVEHFILPMLELADQFRRERDVDPSDITNITVNTAAQIQAGLFEPKEEKIAPKDPYGRHLSAPYALALNLLRQTEGPLSLADVAGNDPTSDEIAQLAGKISYAPEPRFDMRFPESAPARIRIGVRGEDDWEREIDDAYGTPNRPMSQSEIFSKFHRNTHFWSEEKRNDVLEYILHLPEQPNSQWVSKLS